MPTNNSEENFCNAFKEWAKKGNNSFEIQIPPSGSFSNVMPDFFIRNSVTGEDYGVEIKSSEWSIPIGVYPQVKKIDDELKSDNKKFIFLTTAPLSGAFSSNIKNSDIIHIQVLNPEQAVEEVEKIIKKNS